MIGFADGPFKLLDVLMGGVRLRDAPGGVVWVVLVFLGIKGCALLVVVLAVSFLYWRGSYCAVVTGGCTEYCTDCFNILLCCGLFPELRLVVCQWIKSYGMEADTLGVVI